MLPNIAWTKNQPKDYEKYVVNENKVLLALERIGESMALFLVTNTSATIWCRPSILQMNRLRFAEILRAQVFVRVIQNEL